MNVTVYCASSSKIAEHYFSATRELAADLVKHHIAITYGGGSYGLMGCLADSALKLNGKVTGILPRFMEKVEWGHKGLSELILVEDMHERKKRLIQNSDAVVALPGGCGTLEELMEVITLKRLGKFTKPIIILNTRGFYKPLRMLLDSMVKENFMRDEHRAIWTFVDNPSEVIPAIKNSPDWTEEAIRYAAV